MPVARHLRHLYRGKRWAETRSRILARARDRCEQCGKPNHRRVWVIGDKPLRVLGLLSCRWHNIRNQFWSWCDGSGQKWHSCENSGAVVKHIRLRGKQWKSARRVFVRLQVAHRNQIPGDDRDINLEAWCAWCHTAYDRAAMRRKIAGRKDEKRPLLQAIA
jgi:hypothetical protein